MNLFRKFLSIALLLAVSAASTAYARPDRDQRDPGGRGERREFREPRVPDRTPPDQAADSSRRHGRLSPEERRDLRRQINEAGRDIYSPRR
jgi:hypothetical protein